MFAVVLEQSCFVRRDLHARHFFELAALEAKRPVVPWADCAPLIDVPAREISARVRAGVVHHENLSLVDEHGELESVDLDVLPFAALQLAQLTKRCPSHGS